MRRILVALSLAMLALTSATAVRAAGLWDLYQQKHYQQCLDQATLRVREHPDSRDLNHLIGRCLVELGRPQEARPYLEKVLGADGMRDWRTYWSLYYLGLCDWFAGDRDAAKAKWLKGRDDPQMTDIAQHCDGQLKLSGMSEDYDGWPTVAGDHVFCRVSPHLKDFDPAAYVKEADATCERLATFFGEAPSRVIDIIVWQDVPEAKAIAGIGALGYARPDLAVVHTMAGTSCGRQLAEVFNVWANRGAPQVALIDVGVAAYCDGAGASRDAARDALKAADISEFDLTLWWQDMVRVPAPAFDAVAGAWVATLIDRGGMDKLHQLLREPTYVKARDIYGAALLSTYVSEFTHAVLKPS